MDWYLVAGQKIEWDDAPPMFTIKVFRPQLLDKVLAAASNVRDQSDIVIRSREYGTGLRIFSHDP